MIPEIDFAALVRDELRAKVAGLSVANCYCSPMPVFGASGGDLYVQVIDDGAAPKQGSGGNTWSEVPTIRVSIFRKLSLDQPGRLDQALSHTSAGLVVTRFAVVRCLEGNYLNNNLEIALSWTQRDRASSHEEVQGWVSQDLVFQGVSYARKER